jgi:hypothetical protein
LPDSDNIQLLTWDEPRLAPIRLAGKLYWAPPDTQFFDLSPLPQPSFRVIVWQDYQAPVRASLQYYFSNGVSDTPNENAQYSQVIVAYQDWIHQAKFQQYHWNHPVDDSVALEIEVNPHFLGKYAPAKLRVNRDFYQQFAQDTDGPPQEDNNGQYIWNAKYTHTKYKPLPVGLYGAEFNYQSLSIREIGTIGWTLNVVTDSVEMTSQITNSINFDASGSPSIDFSLLYVQVP